MYIDFLGKEMKIDFEVINASTFCTIHYENVTSLGQSTANVKDQFNKIKGRNIAMLRALTALDLPRHDRKIVIAELKRKYNFRMNPGKRRRG